MLTEDVKLSGYSRLEDKAIRLSYLTEIRRSGTLIGSFIKEELIIPGQDVSNREAEIQDLCASIWTPEAIEAYRNPKREGK